MTKAQEKADGLISPPKDFGDGWLTGNASDLCKIMIALGGADPASLVFAIHMSHKGKGLANTATVEKAFVLLWDIEKGVA